MSTKEEIKKQVIAEKPKLTIESRDGVEHRVISTDDEKWLEEKYSNMLNFLKNKFANNLPEGVKDALYGELQQMWNEVSGKTGKLNHISFDLVLHKEEQRYLVD